MYVWLGKEKTLSNLACGWPARRWQTAVQTHCQVVGLCYRFITRKRQQNVRSSAVATSELTLTCQNGREEARKNRRRARAFPRLTEPADLPLSFQFAWPRQREGKLS